MCMFHFSREVTPDELASRHGLDACEIAMTDSEESGALGVEPSAQVALDLGTRVEEAIEATAWYSQSWIFDPPPTAATGKPSDPAAGATAEAMGKPYGESDKGAARPANIALASLDLHDHDRADGHELVVMSRDVVTEVCAAIEGGSSGGGEDDIMAKYPYSVVAACLGSPAAMERALNARTTRRCAAVFGRLGLTFGGATLDDNDYGVTHLNCTLDGGAEFHEIEAYAEWKGGGMAKDMRRRLRQHTRPAPKHLRLYPGDVLVVRCRYSESRLADNGDVQTEGAGMKRTTTNVNSADAPRGYDVDFRGDRLGSGVGGGQSVQARKVYFGQTSGDEMCQARFRFVSPLVLTGGQGDLFKRVGLPMITPSA